MKNSLGDLNNYLFSQIEILDNENLKGEELTEAMNKAKVITGLASQIIQNGALVLKAKSTMLDMTGDEKDVPKILEG